MPFYILGFLQYSRINAHQIEAEIMELLFFFVHFPIAKAQPSAVPWRNTMKLWYRKKLYNSLSSFVNGNNFTKQIQLFFSHFEGIKTVAQ